MVSYPSKGAASSSYGLGEISRPSPLINGPQSPSSLTLMEIIVNDRLGKKVRIKCSKKDTIGQLKKLIAAQSGTKAEKIVLKKWYTIYKDHITLEDYEISDGMSLELYYQ